MNDADPPRPAPELGEPWLAVVEDRLGRDGGSVRRLTRARRRRLLESLAVLARRGRVPAGDVDPDVIALLELIGMDASQRTDSGREFAAMVKRGEAAGLDRGALPHVLQAYIRAVSRIVAVEAGVALGALRGVEAERRPEVIGNLIDALLPSSLRGFDLLHRAMLQDALLEASDGVTASESDFENMAVGMYTKLNSDNAKDLAPESVCRRRAKLASSPTRWAPNGSVWPTIESTPASASDSGTAAKRPRRCR